jgi:hypothetical protein
MSRENLRRAIMDPKHNRNQSTTHRESQHNKSDGHRQQPGQREGHQTEQKKRFGQSK